MIEKCSLRSVKPLFTNPRRGSDGVRLGLQFVHSVHVVEDAGIHPCAGGTRCKLSLGEEHTVHVGGIEELVVFVVIRHCWWWGWWVGGDGGVWDYVGESFQAIRKQMLLLVKRQVCLKFSFPVRLCGFWGNSGRGVVVWESSM